MGEERLTAEQKRQMERLKGVARQYQGKSEGELMRELKKAAAEGKSSGTLSDQKIDRFARQVAPMLNEAQKKKLARIIGELKK